MAFLKVFFVFATCAIISAVGTPPSNLTPRASKSSCSISSISVTDESANATTDIRYQQYALQDLRQGCSLHPKDLAQAVKSFIELYTLHVTTDITDAPTQWSVAVNPEYLDIEFATHWVELSVSHINGNWFAVPVVIFSS